MKTEDRYYDVRPKIVPSDSEALIEITPLFQHVRFRSDATYRVTYAPVEEYSIHSGWTPGQHWLLTTTDSTLRIRQFFEGEQEHVFYIEEQSQDGVRVVGDFRIYSAAPDLFARRPYKGDFHLHTCRSDGVESPPYVAAACRRIGMDFIAITDHRQYAPSLEARDAFAEIPVALRMFPGEEIHPPDSHVHMINFAGRASINAMFADEASYRTEVAAIQERLGALPPGVDPYLYASCVWCFDRIREAGGLGIFCHPYWFTQRRYSPPGALTSHLFDTQPFDAFELIGGYHRHEVDSNTLQVARYHEARAQGQKIPIVGASDSHGCEKDDLFGWFYTLVFSPTLEASDVVQSVRDLYSVAVEAMPGETPRAYGPFRLVKYALYLMREVFPLHDELCVEEGRLMAAHIRGEGRAADALAALQPRTEQLLDAVLRKTD